MRWVVVSSFFVVVAARLQHRELFFSSSSSSFNEETIKFNCDDSEESIRSKGAARVSHEGANYYIGTSQVTSINQDPILVKFESGNQVFCRTDYEVAGADGRGIGLFSIPSLFFLRAAKLYAVFTIDGTQGTVEQDLRRFTQSGWLTSYGQGGGAKVSVVVELDGGNGAGKSGTFIRSQLTNGNTNSLRVTNMFTSFWGGDVRVQALSWFHPLDKDGNRLEATDVCDGDSSPFDYTVTLSSDLTTARSAVCRDEGPYSWWSWLWFF